MNTGTGHRRRTMSTRPLALSRRYPRYPKSVSGRDPITVVVSRQAEGGIIEQPAAVAPANAPTTTQ